MPWKSSKYKKLGANYNDYRKEYMVWTNMHQRCSNPKSSMFPYYGAKGIKVCDRWSGEEGFINFYNDMGARPSSGDGRAMQLDRIDNSKGYSPDNCRWIHQRDNARNRSDNIFITIYGEKMCQQDACALLGINRHTVSARIKRGEDADSAVLGILKRKGYTLTIPERII